MALSTALATPATEINFRAALPTLPARDRLLAARLQSDTEANPDFWSFRRNAIREHAHAFFQYPAMMVPQLLARLLADVHAVWPEANRVYDPFVGSGTVMTETMLRGMDFVGKDINPLAVLLCQVKAGPFFVASLEGRMERVLERAHRDCGLGIEVRFKNWRKWFRRDVAISLSRIVRAIRHEDELWSRRFLWVALAETVRLTSNSRTSTFKLHIRPEDEWRNRNVDPVATFSAISEANVQHLARLRDLLLDMNFLRRGRYAGTACATLGDATETVTSDSKCDLLVTSPPYGDNVSTVPYGQHSYLPLQWIDLADIDERIDPEVLSTTHTLDSMSLGGSRRNAIEEVTETVERSGTLEELLLRLPAEQADAQKKIAAFFRDLDKSLDPLLESVRPNGYMIWIVGNRHVARQTVPLHSILSELLMARGASQVTALERRIPTKRMAVRNSVAQTMRTETILVFRKAE